MTTKYVATLQFKEGGPAVSGDWTSDITAMRTYREWVGLYGSNPSVVIRFIEEADGRQRVLKTWIALREVEGAGADSTPPEANP